MVRVGALIRPRKGVQVILLVLPPDLVYLPPKSGLVAIAQGFETCNIGIWNVGLKVIFVICPLL